MNEQKRRKSRKINEMENGKRKEKSDDKLVSRNVTKAEDKRVRKKE